MRILVVTSSWPRHPGDLAGVFVDEQARALALRGHDVTVLAPGGEGLPVDERPAPRLRVIRPRSTRGPFYGDGVEANLARAPWRVLELVPATLALLLHALSASRTADVLLSHWIVPAGVVLAAVARASGRPHVCIEHSGGAHLLARLPLPLGRAALRGLLADTHHVAVAGAHLRKMLLALVPEAAGRMSVLPVGLPVARYRPPTPFAPPAPGTPLRVLSIARLVPVKGVDTLVRAVAGRPELRLTVVGDGPERSRLERLAAELHADVTFAGRLPTDAVPAALHAHHVLALPSRVLPSGRTEGTPRVLLEALAAARPVVATAVGGAPDVLASGGGLLVPPDDAGALGAALTTLAGDPVRLAALSARAVVAAAAFDWAVLVPRLEALLLAARESTRPPEFFP